VKQGSRMGRLGSKKERWVSILGKRENIEGKMGSSLGWLESKREKLGSMMEKWVSKREK